MYRLIKVGFEYKQTGYEALVRIKDKIEGTDYEVTVMNGDLEKVLYGNHVIKQRNESLLNDCTSCTEQSLLKEAIARALSNFLHIPLEKNIFHPGTEVPTLLSN